MAYAPVCAPVIHHPSHGPLAAHASIYHRATLTLFLKPSQPPNVAPVNFSRSHPLTFCSHVLTFATCKPSLPRFWPTYCTHTMTLAIVSLPQATGKPRALRAVSLASVTARTGQLTTIRRFGWCKAGTKPAATIARARRCIGKPIQATRKASSEST